MIIIPEAKKLSDDADANAPLEAQQSEGLPPSYAAAIADDRTKPGPSASTSRTSPPGNFNPNLPQAPPPPRPTNFVSQVKLNGSVKGSWVVDPRVIIPVPLLPPLASGETENTRRNLYVKSHNGKIVADVTLVPSRPVLDPNAAGGSGSNQQREHAVFAAETLNGSVTFKLHDAAAEPGVSRLPVKIKLFSCNGGLHLYIPRSFRGIIIGQTNWGSTKPSDEVKAQILYVKEDGQTTRLFIGEIGDLDFSTDTWAGDEAKAETMSGHIFVKYDDELEEEEHLLDMPRRRGPIGLVVGLVTWGIRRFL